VAVIVAHLRKRRADVAWLGLWSVVQALPVAVSGWSLAEATDAFQQGRVPAGLSWLGLLAAAAAVGALGTRQVYLRAGALVEPLRDDLVTSVVTGALRRSTAGAGCRPDTESVARLTHQAEIVRDAFAGLLILSSSFAFSIGSALAGLVTLVPAALPYVLPPLAASGALLWMLVRPMAGRQRLALRAEEDIARDVTQAVSGLRDVTACGAEARVLAGLTSAIQRQARAGRSAAVIASARTLCVAVGGWLPLLLVLAAAPSLLGRGVSAGAMVGLIAYITGSVRAALNTMAQGMGAGLIRLTVTLDRLRETGAEAAAPAGAGLGALADDAGQPAVAASSAGSAGRGCEISLRSVRFGYGPDAVPVIDGLSLHIPAGDHLAVVGPSGIGKSSLAALIAGMLSPRVGQVLVDGALAAASGRDWRVVIPQEAYVFSGTLEENLAYHGRGARAREMERAAQEVGLGPLLERLGGLRAHVAPSALAAGERQLIALTRAYLAAAPVAILDEATCFLDPAAEEQAERAFAGRGGTLIVIAHRITSARRARRILVLDGTHAQAGTHDWLLEASPLYRDLAGYWAAPARAT
jgi:ATP-binding cassette, subfamily C, bacterial